MAVDSSPLPDGEMLSGTWDGPFTTFDPVSLQYHALQEFDSPYASYPFDSVSQLLPSGQSLMVRWAESKLFALDLPLVITPAISTQNLGIPVQYSASASAATSGITWSASGGSITSDGLFTANQTGIYIITATAGGSKAYATLRVVSAVSVSIAPVPQAYYWWNFPNGAQHYHAGLPWALKAKVSNHPNTSVIWSLQEEAAAGDVLPTSIPRMVRVLG